MRKFTRIFALCLIVVVVNISASTSIKSAKRIATAQEEIYSGSIFILIESFGILKVAVDTNSDDRMDLIFSYKAPQQYPKIKVQRILPDAKLIKKSDSLEISLPDHNVKLTLKIDPSQNLDQVFAQDVQALNNAIAKLNSAPSEGSSTYTLLGGYELRRVTLNQDQPVQFTSMHLCDFCQPIDGDPPNPDPDPNPGGQCQDQQCQSGGCGSNECSLEISVGGGPSTAKCSVKCNTGYYSCCYKSKGITIAPICICKKNP
jgi:hypothetical protein